MTSERTCPAWGIAEKAGTPVKGRGEDFGAREGRRR
jgi:hypothetical protein